MIKTMIRAAIFDMDGLLIDSEPFWSRASKDAFKTLDIEITDQDMLDVKGTRTPETVEHFRDKYGVPDDKQKVIETLIYDDVTAMIKAEGKLLSGALEALKSCQKAGLPLALASSSTHEIINAVMAKLGIRQLFDHVHSGANEQFSKPHPATFITSAKLLGVPPQQCLVFEDSPAGVLAAKAARMKCVAVPEPEVRDNPFIKTADVILDSLEDFDAAMLQSV